MTASGEQGLSFRAIGRSAAILTGAAAGVQVLAVVREVFVAAQVGLSPEYDALLIGLVLPTTLSGVLSAGTGTAMVPAYLEARDERGLDEALRLAGAICVWVGLAGLAVWASLYVFAFLAIQISGPGLDAGMRDTAIGYLQLLAPITFVTAISGVLYAVCQAEERFAAIALSSFLGSATSLAATLLLWHWLQLGALATANLLGPLVTALVLLAALVRASIAPRLTLWTSRAELSAFASHAAPLTLSSAILQVNGIADRAIASLVAPGAVSALRYADVLVRTPIGAISPAWSTALYPYLIRVGRESGSGLSSAIERSLRYVIAMFVPVAVLTIAVAPVAVAVGYGRGAFTQDDVIRTAQAVAAFAPLVVLLMCYAPLVGALNTRRRGGVLLAAGLLNVCLNFGLDVVFSVPFGAAGIALSSSLTALVVLAFFSWHVARAETAFTLSRVSRTLLRSTLASVPVAIPIGVVSWSGLVPANLLVGLAALAGFGLAGILAYVVVSSWLGLDETRELRQLVAESRTRWRHVAEASE
jgi:putative peptidoglycan lipid II flippase